MSAAADRIAASIEATAASLAAEIEDVLTLPFNDELRAAVRRQIEQGTGFAVATVLRAIADALHDAAAPDRDDNRKVTESELMMGYGLAVNADELARRRRVPHALKRDLTGEFLG